jgi:hypothetical protein
VVALAAHDVRAVAGGARHDVVQRHRLKDRVAAGGRQLRAVGGRVARVGVEVLVGGELRGVDVDGGDDDVGALPGGGHQRQVPRVQVAHRGHQRHAPAGGAVGAAEGAHGRHVGEDGRRGHRGCGAAGLPIAD